MTRHLLDLDDLTRDDLSSMLSLAGASTSKHLENQSVAMVFEKPSVRTRNSTEMATVDLGGHPLMITNAEVGIDERESAEDVARTLGCFHRIIAARVNSHETLARMRDALDAEGWDVSVVNLLSDASHPCQALADMLTLLDEYGDGTDISALQGKTICYVGDANNVAASLAQAAVQLGVNVSIASPDGYQLSAQQLTDLISLSTLSGATVLQFEDPREAVEGADALYSDVWTSMGQEDERDQRARDLEGYSLDQALLGHASEQAIVLHCLPAHRGEEIAHEVLEGPRSRIWTQVAHRRTAMRGIFRFLIGDMEAS